MDKSKNREITDHRKNHKTILFLNFKQENNTKILLKTNNATISIK